VRGVEALLRLVRGALGRRCSLGRLRGFRPRGLELRRELRVPRLSRADSLRRGALGVGQPGPEVRRLRVAGLNALDELGFGLLRRGQPLAQSAGLRLRRVDPVP
jgi:hypothetical protein